MGLRSRIQCDDSAQRLLSKFIETRIVVRISQCPQKDCIIRCYRDPPSCGANRLSLLTALAVSGRQGVQSFRRLGVDPQGILGCNFRPADVCRAVLGEVRSLIGIELRK